MKRRAEVLDTSAEQRPGREERSVRGFQLQVEPDVVG